MGRSFAGYALAVVVSLTPGGAAAPNSKADLAGWYVCEGMNSDGTAYQGLVEIVPLKDTFLVRWMTGNETTVVGVGVFSGGVLAVSYYGNAPAIVVYKADERSLVGEWTMGAEGTIHVETLTKTTRGALPPPPRRPLGDFLSL